MTIKFNILNRWSGEVQFTAEIDCAEDAPTSIKLGLSLKWGYETRAVLRGAVLTDADLTGAVLTGAVLRGAVLRGAVLRGAVLTDADLRGAVLTGADLRDADLTGAVLTDADLRDLNIPFVENIDAKILASIEANKAAGTNGLDMGIWHGERCDETNWCNTTHCRAGYAVCVAGKEGFELERAVGGNTHLAAILLYRKSTPDAPIPDFFCSNAKAMADMKARAAKLVTP